MTEGEWTRESSQVAYEGFARIRRDAYRMPDGTQTQWDILEQHDTVAVVAFTADGTVVLFEQFRVGPRRMLAEIPGGAVDPGETPREAGLRELREETGYAPAAVFHAGSEWSGANSTRRKHVLIAADCAPAGPAEWGEGESGTVREVPDAEFLEHLLTGELSDAGVALRGMSAFVRAPLDDARLSQLQRRVRALLISPPTGPEAPDAWERRVQDVWDAAADEQPEALRAAMEDVLSHRAADDPRALFERASVEDFLGEEAAAVPLYRRALDAGLGAPFRTQALIQLASSLRNVGDPSGAIAVLKAIDPSDPLAPAARGFEALALFDDDKPARALRTALGALAGDLPLYGRALRACADELHTRPRIRVIAVAVVIQDGRVLAEEYAATSARPAFLRAPGGGVQPGETAEAAVRREILEELGATVTETRLLGVLENIFDNEGRTGNEIAYVFAARSAELEALPRGGRLPVLDGETSVGWYPVDDAARESMPFYPPGALDLARDRG
ncbi:tetratricopeptide repeat protein [Microbacterium sp. NPDC079995]|uniref:tetratricopeptide repeat protein n=1 Tax=unclassified Microbacterium TaxID=2609290 RepID=UPI00344C2122